ncbi:MAG TPA: hypothetical protein VKM54_28785 [Myxococcota bacterium]|nr:hypothetical protein [Myxococcota bacterium]
MGVGDDIPCLTHIFVDRLSRGVDHHRGIPGIHRSPSERLALPMIEVQRDRRHRRHGKRHEVTAEGAVGFRAAGSECVRALVAMKEGDMKFAGNSVRFGAAF